MEPQCDADCDGDGIGDLPTAIREDFCSQAELIVTEYVNCILTANERFRTCMSQFLIRGIGTAIACGVACAFTPILCLPCLVGGGLYTYDKYNECDLILTDLRNCKITFDLSLASAQRDACRRAGYP